MLCINWIILGAGGYVGCAYCTHLGEYSNIYRRFLEKDDDLRDDTTNYPSKFDDFSSPPELKTTDYVDAANQN